MRSLVLALAVCAAAAERRIELPPETAAFKPGPGSEVAVGRCLVCHSADYVAIQPPLPKAFWKAGVLKMRDKYGADVPDAEVDPLVEYLASAYGTEPAAAPAKKAEAAPAGTDGLKLAESHRCLTCHSVDRKVTGPAYRDVAAKYAGKPDALATVARHIRNGGSGLWGPAVMPSFPHVPKQDVLALADWILGLR